MSTLRDVMCKPIAQFLDEQERLEAVQGEILAIHRREQIAEDIRTGQATHYDIPDDREDFHE